MATFSWAWIKQVWYTQPDYITSRTWFSKHKSIGRANNCIISCSIFGK